MDFKTSELELHRKHRARIGGPKVPKRVATKQLQNAGEIGTSTNGER